MKSALITGITGQDGAFLARDLLARGYRVHGLVRRTSTRPVERLGELDLLGKVNLLEGDLSDPASLFHAVEAAEPDELYNLAAQSSVGSSFRQAQVTADVTALGTLRLLEAVRVLRPKVRFYQASTSEMFGRADGSVQNEDAPFHPRSPYAVAKLYAHWITVNFREAWGLFACCGILFNHESVLRGDEFVSRKITRGVARIHLGLQSTLQLGNLEARRDWGWAEDYVRAMWLMLQVDRPEDYVVATGETRSVRDFARAAFAVVGLDWEKYVTVDSSLLRPAEVDVLRGDASKARRQLGWKPTVGFEAMVRRMVEADIDREQRPLGARPSDRPS